MKIINVLIVDDSKIARMKIKDALNEICDTFNIIAEAEDGQDGLDKFFANKIDLVITDIEMPNINGIDMTQAMREKDKDVEIVVISSVDIENIKQIFKQQNIKILKKPMKVQQLKILLTHLVGRETI